MWLGGSQSQSGHFGEDKHLLCLLEIEPQFFRHPARSQSLYSNIANAPAHCANVGLPSIVYPEREGKTQEGTKRSCSGPRIRGP
jgi:hypothetical protein